MFIMCNLVEFCFFVESSDFMNYSVFPKMLNFAVFAVHSVFGSWL